MLTHHSDLECSTFQTLYSLTVDKRAPPTLCWPRSGQHLSRLTKETARQKHHGSTEERGAWLSSKVHTYHARDLGSIPSTSLTPSEQGRISHHFLRTSYDANQAIQEHLRDTLTVWMSVSRYNMVLHIWIREKPGLCGTLREALVWSKPTLISSHLTGSSEEPLRRSPHEPPSTKQSYLFPRAFGTDPET